MARSKNSRPRGTTQSQHQSACPTKHPHCRCVGCVTERTLAGKNDAAPASLGHRNPQDVVDSIEYHWKVLSPDVRQFLLAPRHLPLTLRTLVRFWSRPQYIDSAKGSCATSISGSSWFLALNYLFLDKLGEARAMILNGGFMSECSTGRIRDILEICKKAQDHELSQEVVLQYLPMYRQAFMSVQSKESMERFLNRMLPPDYRRRMSFASQAGKKHGVVGDYVGFISNDWTGGASSSSAASMRKQTKGVENTTIEVILMNTDTNEQSKVSIGSSTTLKKLFNDYADERGTSLRSLRFAHQGKILFVSSAGNKTAEQLGIHDGDSIQITSVASSTEVATSPMPSTKSTARKSASKATKKGKGKGKRKQRTAGIHVATAADSCEDDRIRHSKQLSQVFDEARPAFKLIRQRLNSLHMERTLPKRKRSAAKKEAASPRPVCNPPTSGLGGKAGRTHYMVQVGEPQNLYKTTKRSAAPQTKPIVTDLHGLTKEEALTKLDASLPRWTDVAMQGSYPFVIPVKIICGAGGQVLSEAVEEWVSRNENVANAPKNAA